ncbi:hypothetical protein M2366_003811 [Aeromonas sp. BIGb0405]|nr:hypothetical protein [Aeromonas sp. BIGb0405]
MDGGLAPIPANSGPPGPASPKITYPFPKITYPFPIILLMNPSHRSDKF